MSAIDWAKFCAGMQWGDVRVDSEGMVTETPVAHAMSQPGAVQYVSNAAWEALIQARPVIGGVTGLRDEYAKYFASLGAVLRTVEEWREMMPRRVHDMVMETVVRVGQEHLAEVNDLRSQLAAKTAAFECAMQQVKNAQDLARKAIDGLQRLREGREDETLDAEQVCKTTNMGETLVRAMATSTTNLVLDPRLGIQQPEGEPVQPLPYWRRSGV